MNLVEKNQDWLGPRELKEWVPGNQRMVMDGCQREDGRKRIQGKPKDGYGGSDRNGPKDGFGGAMDIFGRRI